MLLMSANKTKQTGNLRTRFLLLARSPRAIDDNTDTDQNHSLVNIMMTKVKIFKRLSTYHVGLIMGTQDRK